MSHLKFVLSLSLPVLIHQPFASSSKWLIFADFPIQSNYQANEYVYSSYIIDDSSTSKKKKSEKIWTLLKVSGSLSKGITTMQSSRLYSRRRVLWREVKRWCGRSLHSSLHSLHQGPKLQGETKRGERVLSSEHLVISPRLCLPSGSRQDEEAGADSFMFSILPRAGHIKHSCIDLGDNCSSSTSLSSYYLSLRSSSAVVQIPSL